MYILDGAMGTMIQGAALGESDFRGERFVSLPLMQRGNNDLLCLTQPELIKKIHRAYLEAGADIISTNTFNASRISQEDYGTAEVVREMNVAGARLAREVCDRFMEAHPHRKCYVAGSIGPTNKSASMSPKVEEPGYRAVTFGQLVEAYREQVEALLDGGVDMLLIETVFDTLNAKAALFAVEEVQAGVRVMLSATVADESGRLLSGQSLEAFVASVAHVPLWSIGLNCSFGAEKLAPFVRQLSQIAPCRVSVHPNAGLPDAFGAYNETPEGMAERMRLYVTEGWVDIIGGCCGTTPEHIAAIAQMVSRSSRQDASRQDASRQRKTAAISEDVPTLQCTRATSAADGVPTFSGLDILELRDPIRFALIGERTNVAGSKKFARLIREEHFEEALGVAREMVRAGAHIIDINMDDPMLDAPQAMVRFLNQLAAEPELARLPVMLDSSRWEVLEAGLACVQGKSLVNSISLKEGEEVFKARAAKIRQYGAAAVVMAFDEEGQATTLERRIAICSRAYRILTEEVGYRPQDIIFDPNVLTIGTGMEVHRTFAVDFIETVRYIKQHLPGALVSGGVSNLSFAFRGNNEVREAMHTVFLYHAIQAGLDMAIVNPATMMPYESIPLPLRQAVEDVVLNSDADATARIVELFRSPVSIGQLAGTMQDGTMRAGMLQDGMMQGGKKRDGVMQAGTMQGVVMQAGAMQGVVMQAGMMQEELWRKEDVSQRLAQAVVRGETQWLEEDIREAMATGYRPIHIIEELLMEGMNRVGQLFGAGKMFLPQVIKSARVMKQAVMALQPWLHEEDAERDAGHGAERDAGRDAERDAGHGIERGVECDAGHDAERGVTQCDATGDIGMQYGATQSGVVRKRKGVIATVKGDVHDIGKNIAAVVMECHHYRIIDLGVMVPAADIVRAVVEHRADFVGLSGLITPSLDEMCTVAEAMESAGFKIPLLIGGATTSKEYIALRMAHKYSGLLLHCPDASANARHLTRWFAPEQREAFIRDVEEEYAQIRAAHTPQLASNFYSVEEARKFKLSLTFEREHLAVPAWIGVRDFDIPVAELRELINWNALFALWEVHQMSVVGQQKHQHQQQEQLQLDANILLNRLISGEWGQIRGVVGFFPANSDGAERIIIYADEQRTATSHLFTMPRQLQRNQDGDARYFQDGDTRCLQDGDARCLQDGAVRLSLADFVAPASSANDYIGLFAVNASPLGIEQQIDSWRTQGDEYRAILLRSLCDRLAEATSLWLHRKVQTEWWGYGANKGIRPAFGYPSCPDHAPKVDALRLLEARQRIGLTLTDTFMLQPVSALCGLYFAHAHARYFTL